MARAKRAKRLVVSQTYFELIERKAELLDELLYDNGSGWELTVRASLFAERERLEKAWNKAGAPELCGTEEPYEEPEAER